MGLERPARRPPPPGHHQRARRRPPTTATTPPASASRKVTDNQNATSSQQRIYLGGYEVYREYDTTGTVTLERQSLHVGDGQRTGSAWSKPRPSTPVSHRRPGHADPLPARQPPRLAPSSNSTTPPAIITYEEYYPYGSTSFQTGRSQAEVSLKRYRYTGKERDTENGFYYHGARYYAPWLGRWISCDPAGHVIDGLNLYSYVRNRPVVLSDSTGHYAQAGHYYTVYFLSLAAGFDTSTAFRNAFYAQLPDLLEELDAKSAQIDYLKPGSPVWEPDWRDFVQTHLHALTGGSSDSERAMTAEYLAGATPGTANFGFLLHRYGDVFAHTVLDEPAKLYGKGFGHFRHWTRPDEIQQRPGQYTEYAESLFDILSKMAIERGLHPRLTPLEVKEFARSVGSVRAALEAARMMTVLPVAPEARGQDWEPIPPQGPEGRLQADFTQTPEEQLQIAFIRAAASALMPSTGGLDIYAPESQGGAASLEQLRRNLSAAGHYELSSEKLYWLRDISRTPGAAFSQWPP